jgi:hypothetical protein
MKWIIALTLGLLIVAGIAVAISSDKEEVQESITSPQTYSCGKCAGGCNSEGSCSSPSCGYNSGTGCGCKR